MVDMDEQAPGMELAHKINVQDHKTLFRHHNFFAPFTENLSCGDSRILSCPFGRQKDVFYLVRRRCYQGKILKKDFYLRTAPVYQYIKGG